METDKKFNSQIERLNGEIMLLSQTNEKAIEDVKKDVGLVTGRLEGFSGDIARLEDDLAESNVAVEGLVNSLADYGSTLNSIDSNVEELRLYVNSNIQDISIKADKDLSNVNFPQLTPDGQVHTESGYTTYMTTDKKTWYIIHPTGKKECGMSYTDVNNDADTTLTMPISFSDTNFVCTFSATTQNVYATIRVEKTAVNKVRIRLGSSNNAVNKQPTSGCIKCEGI